MKDWIVKTLAGALVALLGVLGGDMRSRLNAVEADQTQLKIESAVLKDAVNEIKNTLERIERKVDKR